jgi:EAL domain-containing protein (putative c-di-GMP-specific phosphodiesterase class I)
VTEAKRRRVVRHVHRPGPPRLRPGHLQLRSGVAAALRDGQIEVRYQPKADMRGGLITGVEALARWRHPVDGLRPPAHFLPEMDQQGLMPALTEYMMRVALADCARWRAGGEQIGVSVNVPPSVLVLDGFGDLVAEVVRDAGVPPWALCLEITENSMMVVRESVLTTLAALRSVGVRISLDDFGTGYSSLSYLREIPADELKLDSSFLRGIHGDGADVATEIIRSVVDLAHAVGMRAVVEGIETSRDWAVLAALGADEAQGFFVSRPVTDERLPAVLGEWAGRTRWSDPVGPRVGAYLAGWVPTQSTGAFRDSARRHPADSPVWSANWSANSPADGVRTGTGRVWLPPPRGSDEGRRSG